MKQVYFITTGKDKNKFMRFLSFSGDTENNKTNNLLRKFIKLFLIAAVMIPLLNSCEYLDYNELDQYDQEDIMSEFSRVSNVLNHVYSYLPADFMSVDGAMRSSASDDAEHEWDLSDIHKFNDGSWNAIVTLDDNWDHFYSGIRAANVFLTDMTGLTFDDIRYNDNYWELMEEYEFYPYEARFLRAFYYFELIKRYWNVPFILTPLTQEEANSVSPTSFETILDFIISECDAASANLPESHADVVSQDRGRVTKGIAMALKARALLYTASPLHNPANDQGKWITAAQAAKEIIDELGGSRYTLSSYTSIVNNMNSTELIFERRESSSREFEEANTAVGFIGGNTGTCPTQNLVDCYEMQATGLGIDEAGSGYDPSQPYVGRDPRLAATIIYNGTTWREDTVEIWYGGLNAPPKLHTTKTGYYLRKYLIESISLNPVNPSTDYHYWVIFRYGEVLLNYAEAMNEAFGPEVTGPGTLDMTALEAVNMIRARASMPDFPNGMTQDDFREKLRNERRVELAFEDHRFWDIRRWKIGPTTTDIYGVEITKVGTDLTYNTKLVETRVWNDRMYLYPIPQTELFINDNLVQNTGW